jgi:hypothetical protein
VVVQYDSATGTALWAKAATSGGAVSLFYGVAADGQGHIYAVGRQNTNNSTVNYGGASATVTGGTSGNNALIVKYDTNARTALWARAANGAVSTSRFVGVAVDRAGNFAAVGYQTGNAYTFIYGPGISRKAAFTGSSNAVVVWYR